MLLINNHIFLEELIILNSKFLFIVKYNSFWNLIKKLNEYYYLSIKKWLIDYEDINYNGFEGIISSKKLYVNQGNDTDLHEDLYKLNITELILYENSFTIIPKSIFKIHNLTKLDMHNNELKKLPENFGDLINLEYLDLSYNNIIELPENFTKLINLHNLDLNFNQLSYLPENFGDLKNLTYLNLNDNQLIWLPENFGNLKNLTYLNLGGDNILEYLPENFGNLKNLTYLDLGCKLKKLPQSIMKLSKLKTFYINEQFLDNTSKEYLEYVKIRNC